MHNKEREEEILNVLRTQGGFVTVKALCEHLFTSESSVRRDLKALEGRGLVRRAYGGAELSGGIGGFVTFSRRTRQNQAAKRDIARKAAALVRDGDVIFLDQSSTAFYLAGELARRNLTVVTCSIEIMMLLSDSAVRVVASGGSLSGENRMCLIGGDARATFEKVHAAAAFFSAARLSPEGVISDYDREEILVREAMLQNAAKKVFLCDSTKFGTRAPWRQCDLSDVDVMVSEGQEALRYRPVADQVVYL